MMRPILLPARQALAKSLGAAGLVAVAIGSGFAASGGRLMTRV